MVTLSPPSIKFMIGERKASNHWSQFQRAYTGAGVIMLALAATLAIITKAQFWRASREFHNSQTPHKSDKELIDNFLNYRSEFDQLLGMVMEDKSLYRVDYDWTAPENPESVGITATRIDEYRKLMKKLGILRGFSAYRERGRVEFFTSYEGSAKGYLYTKKPPLDLDDNLDDVIQKGLHYGHRPIEGDWYLFYRGD